LSDTILEVDNLVRHYMRPRKSLFSKRPIVRAVDGVSFRVRQGESFGIVGESGSGKSTLARALLALEAPTSGEVRFRGKNLAELSANQKVAVCRHIQMIFQDPFGSLDPKHKVRSIVTEPFDMMSDITRDERHERAVDALVSVGLQASDLDKYPHEFSGGQRQRIAIARALVTRPELIVADEPVSALDVSVQAQVLNLMMDLQQEFNLTYVIISHDLAVVRHVTDRLAVMQAGVIVEQGNTSDIFDQPKNAYTQGLLDAVLDIETAEPSSDMPPINIGATTDSPSQTTLANEETPELAATAGGGIDTLFTESVEPSGRAPFRESEPMNEPEEFHNGSTAMAAPPKAIPAGEMLSISSPSEPKRTEREPDRSVPTSALSGQNLIDGQWRDAFDDRLINVVNPSNGENVGHIARGGSTDIDRAVKAAHRAMEGPWGRMPAFERGRVLARLAELVLDNVDRLTTLEALDVGKPLRQAKADALALARYFEFYGGAADKVHGQTIPYQDGYTVLTLREPHGVTGHIVPWNYPMQIIGRSVGAALAMGNACVLKPGEDASLTALEIGKLALEAGLPQGVLNIVTGLGEEAGASLAAHHGIDHLSFTGSVATGKRVQQAAATHTCPVTLELGGKSPQIVFADADLDKALPFLVNAAIQNAGQTCSAGSRVLIQDWIYDEVVHRLAERFNALVVGPAHQDPDCGPVINKAQMKRIDVFLEQARADRIERLAEGTVSHDVPDGGFYVKPLLLGKVPQKHPIAREEIFGPVLAAIRFTDEDEAVRIANNTAYGLVAGIWTRDGARQMRLANAIKTGQVFINNYGAGGGVELPFGGVKRSGFGREKGFEALYGFSTLKTVAIHHG
jgi:aldehyde dehydrogenase (NAD+)